MDELTPRPINKVGLALVRDGRLLLARSKGAHVFQIPGGKVEPGDADDIAALVREIGEELGVTLVRETASFLGCFSAPAAGRTGLIVSVKLFRGDVSGDPAPCSEIEELVWLDPFDTGETRMSEVVRTGILPFVREMLTKDAG